MKCLYNTHSDNVAGYCHNPQHPYAMTWCQIQCKNCLGKQCENFEKEPKHQIWHQREVKKQKRKKRKERLNNYVDSIKGNI
jgi:hypothetical protein